MKELVKQYESARNEILSLFGKENTYMTTIGNINFSDVRWFYDGQEIYTLIKRGESFDINFEGLPLQYISKCGNYLLMNQYSREGVEYGESYILSFSNEIKDKEEIQKLLRSFNGII